jgi:metal-responsive CopG/Arc/MetJ family transcriptional regulator
MFVYTILAKVGGNMNTTTVNISFQGSLLAEIDRVANAESRSRSELLREAARSYIARKRRWDDIFRYGKTISSRGKLTEADVANEINAYRRGKAKK